MTAFLVGQLKLLNDQSIKVMPFKVNKLLFPLLAKSMAQMASKPIFMPRPVGIKYTYTIL